MLLKTDISGLNGVAKTWLQSGSLEDAKKELKKGHDEEV